MHKVFKTHNTTYNGKNKNSFIEFESQERLQAAALTQHPPPQLERVLLAPQA